jgi:outer membrane immunogenic protein
VTAITRVCESPSGLDRVANEPRLYLARGRIRVAMAKPKADRLEEVHAILINPRQAIGSIQMLAAEHGFTDLIKFNQLFRERYGSGPAELRKAVEASSDAAASSRLTQRQRTADRHTEVRCLSRPPSEDLPAYRSWTAIETPRLLPRSDSRCAVTLIVMVRWISADLRLRVRREASMKKLALAISVLAISAAGALAADLGTPVYKAPIAAPIAVYDWTGFYVGLNGGYSWGKSSNTYNVTLPATIASQSQSMNGWVFGGQAGYNWQFSRNWVFGLEGDINATGQDGTAALAPFTTVTTVVPPVGALALPTTTTTTTTAASFEERLPWLATVRGRLGVQPLDGVLLYATGGLAVGNVKSTATVTTTTTTTLSFGTPPAPTAAGFSSSSSTTKAGWTIGTGIEGSIGGNWTAKLEYLYVDLGTVSNSFVGVGAFSPLTVSSHVTDNIVRVGVNYRFGGPIVARY